MCSATAENASLSSTSVREAARAGAVPDLTADRPYTKCETVPPPCASEGCGRSRRPANVMPSTKAMPTRPPTFNQLSERTDTRDHWVKFGGLVGIAFVLDR